MIQPRLRSFSDRSAVFMRPFLQALGVLPLLIAFLGGMLAGVGAFAFGYGQGHSYMSDDPRACVNCHIMQSQYDDWIRSSHAAVATCNDCHMPDGFVHRWAAKADNGFFHSWAFTFQNFHEPIQIKERNLRILQNNCIACHRTTVHQMTAMPMDAAESACTRCHHSVGHAARSAGTSRRISPK